jgi:hypothetical protein
VAVETHHRPFVEKLLKINNDGHSSHLLVGLILQISLQVRHPTKPAGTMMSENKSCICEIAQPMGDLDKSSTSTRPFFALAPRCHDIMGDMSGKKSRMKLFNGSHIRSVEGLSLFYLIISLVDRFPMSWFVMDGGWCSSGSQTRMGGMKNELFNDSSTQEEIEVAKRWECNTLQHVQNGR